ncbi:MAG: cobalamin-binding protein [Bacteroidetes bacterium QS_8_64_10]|nr:MAG: cobalamin-binding protein [Bacteroidetes bacterium QS_8_64_10]
MRIASLLPAATEWLAAFDALDDLVARSHECDWPPAARSAPVVTSAAIPADATTSAAIDRSVQETLSEGLSLYDVDLEQLRRLSPDLVLTQAQCEACAVSLPQLEDMLEEESDARPELLSMQPMTLKEVFDEALRLGKKAGRIDKAMAVIADGEERLRRLRERLGLNDDTAERPTVACIEWMDPLMTAGHWMPDVARQAGGKAVLAGKGEPSRRIIWDALREADPDVIAVMPCGFSLDETRADLYALTDRPGWRELGAVRAGRVFLFDGSAYFNRPGPRLYRSVELLAAALHPDSTEVNAGDREMQHLADVRAL